ncbi:MAG: AEC family transporter [Desulfitobacteriia bacterium]|jgi:predicted permease
MWVFINIILNIIIPIFLLIATGFIAQKALRMDLRTIVKINIYIFIPSLLFNNLYETNATWELFSTIAVYIAIVCLSMFLLGEFLAKILKYPRGIKRAFINSLLFFNSGNYGLAVVELAFPHNPLAITVQIFILLIQNITANTIGVFSASSGKKDYKEALKNVLVMPSLYVLLLVTLIKVLGITVPEIIMIPIRNISDGFVAVALMSLGIQLAEVKLNFNLRDVFPPTFIRLVLAPIIGLFLVRLMGIDGILAKTMILGVATPSSVTTAIIAKEFDNEPEYAARIVFITTLLSTITISSIIFLLN